MADPKCVLAVKGESYLLEQDIKNNLNSPEYANWTKQSLANARYVHKHHTNPSVRSDCQRMLQGYFNWSKHNNHCCIL